MVDGPLQRDLLRRAKLGRMQWYEHIRGVERRARRGLSLVEVMIALAVLGVLGIAVQSAMIQTVAGLSVDRESELKRHVVLDLLERFCHPYSDIDSLFPPGTTGTATKQITVEEALALTALPDEESAVASQILKSASISGFSLIWSKALTVAAGDPERALRLDRLVVKPVQVSQGPGATIASFRMFAVRGR